MRPMVESFNWLKPAPLWAEDGLDIRQADFFRPLLLEFRSDDIMDDFLAAVAAPNPLALSQAIAVPGATDQAVKLYQPAHGRFYLTCGSLCCRVPGFPDRAIRTEDGE